MSATTLPYRDTHYFSRLMCDYLSEKEDLSSFYHRFPKLDLFEAQFKEKAITFSPGLRKILVEQLKQQYKQFTTSNETKSNIERLSEKNTFTITTGHQLNLFTGPLYFLYKIFSVINLTERLNKEYPKNYFVPIYWMATEDHDFDEINYFSFSGKKMRWNRDQGGAVGRLSNEGLEQISALLKKEFGSSIHGIHMAKLFDEAYMRHENLADATRYLANELFKEYGLVIVDGDDSELKKAMIPYVKLELLENRSYQEVTKTTIRLKKLGYPEQVHPREINLFYLSDNSRGRIHDENGSFYVKDTDISFTKEELLDELQNFPDRFSPNSLLRPLYQEVVLPNICYVGGGGELAYWFQLKDYFKSVSIPFPILLLRNSALLVPSKLMEKLKKLKLKPDSLFLAQHELLAEYTKEISKMPIDFTKQREHLKKQFKDLYALAEQTDNSFLGAVGAQEKKQLNGLDHLEKRLLRAEKRKHEDVLNRLRHIQDILFPNQSLQERSVNFSDFYIDLGPSLFKKIHENLDPLLGKFTVIEI